MNTSLNNKEKRISDSVIPRIINYLKVAQQLEKENASIVSSDELAKRTNISAFLVRKDLANFGRFGKQGTGYVVSHLKDYLLDIIGGKEMCNLVLIGVGNLGSALLNYKGFEEEGLKFVAAFDKEPSKIGKICGNVIVENIDNMKESITRIGNAPIGVIAVPSKSAQIVADKLVEAGIFSVLNFAPTIVSVPSEVTLRNVDLSLELKALQYFSVNR